MKLNLKTLSLTLNVGGCAAVLGVAAACYGFAYTPLQQESVKLTQNEEMLRRLQASEERVKARNRVLREQIDRLGPKQRMLAARLPTAPREEELLRQLSRLAIKSDIQLQDFQPQGQSESGDLTATIVKLHLRGDYEKLCRFVAGIETLNRLTSIVDAKVRIVEPVIGMLDIQIRLLAYYQSTDTAGENNSAP